MKKKLWFSLLAAEAAVCVAFCLLQARLSTVFAGLLAFPFQQLGLGLRALSLSGAAGNAAAIVLYVALCLSPAAALLFIKRRRKLRGEDALLGVLAVFLFPVLYLSINPGLFTIPTQGVSEFGVSLLGGCAWSVLVGWAVLRLLRVLSESDIGRLQRCLSLLLGVLAVYFVYAAFGVCFSELLSSLDTLHKNNTASFLSSNGPMAMTEAFLALHWAVAALPYLLDLAIVFAARRLLAELNADRYSEAAVAAADRLAALCRKALAAVVLSNVCFNLLQLLFASSLLVISGLLYLPLFSIAFLLAALLLARFLAENRQLKQDNDLFI